MAYKPLLATIRAGWSCFSTTEPSAGGGPCVPAVGMTLLLKLSAKCWGCRMEEQRIQPYLMGQKRTGNKACPHLNTDPIVPEEEIDILICMCVSVFLFTSLVWLSSVNCTGAEPNIFSCTHDNVGLQNCDAGKLAALSCSLEPFPGVCAQPNLIFRHYTANFSGTNC